MQSALITAARAAARLGARRRLLLAVQLVALSLIFAPAASAEEYRLGTQDKLKIRVVEWQTIEGTFREWDAVSGEYTVGFSGKLSLPLVGETPAAGKTTAEVAEAIGTTLEQKFGLSSKPEASVELAEYRPFYVSGDVQAPGQYPYAPELTVVKATSIAGGIKKSGTQRAERDFINAKGSFDVLAEERLRLLVKRARLKAEAENKAEIETPEEAAANPKLPMVMADEMAIKSARQKKLNLQLEAIDNLKGLLEREIESLEKKIVTQTRQINLAKGELNDIGTLADKGLVVNTRISTTERAIADMEGKLLDLETSILRAKQDISKATQDAIDIRNTADAERAFERQQTEAALVESTLKMDMNRGLMAEALTWAPSAVQMDEDAPDATFLLVRTIDGQQREIEASEHTAVLPGDVIKVRVAVLQGPARPGQ